MAKQEVLFDVDKHLYQVQETQADGSLKVKDSIPSIEVMETNEAVSVYLGLARSASNKRVAAATLIAAILTKHEAHVSAWRGKGDKTKPTPKELLGTFQRLEAKFFESFMETDHPYHNEFLGRLPPNDSRGGALDVDGQPNWSGRLEAFLTMTRKDPSYSNTKSLVLALYSYVGWLPVGQDGRLIPPEAMAAMVRAVRVTIPPDTSYRGALAKLHRILMADSDEGDKPTEAELPAVEAMLADLFVKVKELRNIAATKATQARENVPQQAGDMIQRAQDAAKINVEGIKPVTT